MTKLQEMRYKMDLTQEEISKLLNIHRRTYACYELGTREPRFFNKDKILKLAKENDFPLTENDLMRTL